MMYDNFDTNEILFNLINIDSIKAAISGGVYNDGRPINSQKEDIVVNTITVSQAYKPQRATSNINIHVPDLSNGIKNITRLKEISRLVRKEIEENKIFGKSVYVDFIGTIQEPQIKQHFVNIRINWVIYDSKEN